MIFHIALFKWKENVSNEVTTSIMRDVKALKEKVPGILDIHCGENFSEWSTGYTHAFVITAENRAALEAYRMHSDHKAVANRIDQMDAGSMGFDFEDR